MTPQFPEIGALTSCRPKYLVLQLGASVQLSDAVPRLVEDGADLTEIAGLPQAGLSGTLLAFDFAGLEIEADAALATLGSATVANVPDTPNRVRVQIVDILGKPMSDEMIATLRARLGPANVDVTFDFADEARRLHRLNFPGAERTLKIREAAIPDTVAADQRHLWRGTRVAVWPGRDARLQPVKATAEFDLNAGVPSGQEPPAFVRLCVYHPAQTMQTAYTGELNDEGRFTKPNATDGSPPSGFALAADADAVTVFNDGESYLRDVYDAIATAGAGDRLYITDWSTNAHLHLRGTLSRMGLGPLDVDSSAVDADLALIDQHRMVLSSGDDMQGFLVLADRLDRGDAVRAGLEYEIRRVPPPGVKDKTLTKGFVRPGGLYAFSLSGDQGMPFASRVIARWKDPAGGVHETQRILSTDIAPKVELAIPDAALALGITADDPPSGTVIRKSTLDDLKIAIGAAGGPLWLLVVDTTTGRHVMHDLTPTPEGTDVVLGPLPEDTSAIDELYAVVFNADPGLADPLANAVVSGARRLKYTSSQHVLGDIPLATEELGALLRRAIADGVAVRALYWDQFLANLDPGEALDSGHSNNQEMTALLNATRNGKRGFAVRDRATRPFGSFHQKGVVLVRGTQSGIEATAWLGGIDLARGRWDSEEHPQADPDRQCGKWWDAQIRLTGPAAVDVLRNFAQRWWAIGAFIKDADNFRACVPVDAPPEIRTDTQTNIVELPPEPQLARPLHPAALRPDHPHLPAEQLSFQDHTAAAGRRARPARPDCRDRRARQSRRLCQGDRHGPALRHDERSVLLQPRDRPGAARGAQPRWRPVLPRAAAAARSGGARSDRPDALQGAPEGAAELAPVSLDTILSEEKPR